MVKKLKNPIFVTVTFDRLSLKQCSNNHNFNFSLIWHAKIAFNGKKLTKIIIFQLYMTLNRVQNQTVNNSQITFLKNLQDATNKISNNVGRQV